MKTGISLLTMGSGNVNVLKKTLESVKGICDEVIYGDLLIWPEDKKTVRDYELEFNLKRVYCEFNVLFKYGFSSVLNTLASYATNSFVMYLNTSEIVEEDYGILESIKNNPECNAFFFTHKTDPHRWYRTYNKTKLKWSGRIHEALAGDYRPYHKPIFQMADLPKDMDNIHKAACLDSLKEAVYFEQYIQIAEHPELLGETDPGWLGFALNDYDSFKERLLKKGKVYEALKSGDYQLFMQSLESEEYREFKSSIAVEFQNDPQFLNK